MDMYEHAEDSLDDVISNLKSLKGLFDQAEAAIKAVMFFFASNLP